MKKEYIDRQPKKVLRKQASMIESVVCSPDHPASMNCVFYELEDFETATSFTSNRLHEGHGHLLHGAFISALVDETMGRAINNLPVTNMKPVVTAYLNLNYKQPIPIGETVYSYGRMTKHEGKKYFMECVITFEDGSVAVRGEALFIEVDVAGDNKTEGYRGIDTEKLSENDPKIM